MIRVILYIVCVLCSGSLLMQGVSAQSDPEADISSLLNDMRLKYKDIWDRSTMVDKVVDGRNLFDASYANELYKIYEKNFQTLDLIYDHLTTQESYCPEWTLLNTENATYLTYDIDQNQTVPVTLSKKDVVNIFSETSYGVELLWLLESQRAFDSSLSLSSDNSFAASCKWIVWCRDGLTQLSWEDRQTGFQDGDDADREVCADIVSDLYERYSFQVETNLDYDTNRDREIYVNGVVEQDRGQFCDINQKLESITKMVSSTTQDFPSFSSFDPQQIPRDDDVRLPTEYAWADEDAPDESDFGNINKYVPTRSVPNTDEQIEKNAEYLADVWPAQASLSPGNAARLIPKPKVWWVASLLGNQPWANTAQVGWASGAIQNIQCEVNEFEASDEAVDLYKEWSELDAFLNTYVWDIDTQARSRLALAHPDNLTPKQEQDHNAADEPLIDKADLEAMIADIDTLNTIEWDAPELIESMKQSFGECIQEFTDEDPESVWAQIKTHASSTSKIFECVRQVFCDEITDPSGRWLYTIRYCSVPARERRIANTMRVDSLSDTLDAHIAVLENMNNNGNMVKHVKTKEFLEFQVFGLQYSPRFAFSLNTNLKKPRKTQDEKVKKEIAQQTLGKLRKTNLQEYGDIHNQLQSVIWPDTYNAALEQASNVDLQTADELSTNFLEAKRIQESLTSISSEEILHQQSNQIHHTVIEHGSETLQDQQEFWSAIQWMFANLNDIVNKKYQSLGSGG